MSNPQPLAAPITADEIAALRDALSKATPGEWTYDEDGVWVDGVERGIFISDRPADGDTEFIALAHNLAPKLLAALDAAEAKAVEFAWDAFNRGTRIGYKSPTLGTHLETDKSTIKAAEYLEARGLLKRTGERMWQRVEGGK